MIVKYHLCIDNVIRTDEELNNTNTSSLINSTYLVDTIISKINKMFIFKDIKGFESKKVVLENELYFIK